MLKSRRKVKAVDNVQSGLGGKSASTKSLNKGQQGEGGNTMQPSNAMGAPGSEWTILSKTVVKPTNQMQLAINELDEEYTRILNANNPNAPQNIARFSNKEKIYKSSPNVDHLIVHYEYEGHMHYVGASDDSNNVKKALIDDGTTTGDYKHATEEAVEGEASGNPESAAKTILDEDHEKTTKKKSSPNQFNHSERAAQTLNRPLRDRTTNTDPPPHRSFSGEVNQWRIHDSYTEDLSAKDRIAKEKIKTAAGSKSHKDDSSRGSLSTLHSQPSTILESQHEDYNNSTEMNKILLIMERMCNQNTYDDIVQDYRYWEDTADEVREGKGVLLPLWQFLYDKEHKKQVTSIDWNPDRSDLFAVGFGSYDFIKQGPGILACFTLKNPSYPEFIFHTPSGVMCLDFHPNKPSLIAVGLYNGVVMVYDLSRKLNSPLCRSTSRPENHSEPIWQVLWQKDDLADNSNFCAISADGYVMLWTLIRNDLVSSEIIRLRLDHVVVGSGVSVKSGPDLAVSVSDASINDSTSFISSSGSCIDFHITQLDVFIAGTEEGKIYKCSKAYNNQYLAVYEGHPMAVYALRFNPFYPSIFLSASADWTLKLWEVDHDKPIMSFDLGSAVGDVAWAPYSSTVFSAVTAEGKVFVFDLNVNKYEPICEQMVARKAKLTHLTFNPRPSDPILLVGDERGQVSSLKLSPNLRRTQLRNPATGREETEVEKIQRIVFIAMGKSLEELNR